MYRDSLFKLAWGLIFLCVFSGCYPGIKKEITKFNSLKKQNRNISLSFTDDLDFSGLGVSIERSLGYFRKVPETRKYQYGEDTVPVSRMIESLETFKTFIEKNPSKKELGAFIKNNFQVYKSIGNDKREVLFTGYYEPTYEGSLEKDKTFVYPVLSRPDNLLYIDLSLFSNKYRDSGKLVARVNPSTNRVLPYYSRKEINNLRSYPSEPIVWLKSRIDRFFLEIQGSGRILLKQGGVLRVHYAASNGNAYRSIGRYLMAEGEILKEDVSMQAIRKWLEENPDRMDEVFHHNESFVFFRKEKGGPYGSLGVKISPLRSIATDSKLFPKGSLCFIQVELPEEGRPEKWRKSSLFVLNQDTGGAIRGPARADVFCGNGDYAEFTAGHMNKYGKLYFLVLKPGL